MEKDNRNSSEDILTRFSLLTEEYKEVEQQVNQ